MKNSNLYNASYHLYQAATFLDEVDKESKEHILDMAKQFLDRVEITEEDQAISADVDKYAKMIKDEE